jgi:hypothetical protein
MDVISAERLEGVESQARIRREQQGLAAFAARLG